MADDTDISGMPDPATIGLTSTPDPTAGMPAPEDLFRKYHGLYPEAKVDPDQLKEFMANPPGDAYEPTLRKSVSMLSGLPRAAAGYAAAVPAGVASVGGQLSGALGAALDPTNAPDYLEKGRERGREWSEKVSKLADYVPATAEGAKLAADLQSLPVNLTRQVAGEPLKAAVGENAYGAVSDIAQDIGTDLPALGAPAAVRAGAKVAAKAARAARDAYTAEANTANPDTYPTTEPPPKPEVGTPVTAAQLRAQPNPIPPPDGTAAAVRAAPAKAAPAATFTPPGGATVAGTPEIAAPEAPPAAAPEAPTPKTALGEQVPGQRGSVRLFNSPAEEGPKETPTPDKQSERAAHLDAIDKLSGGLLPTRRISALTGDYNATGDDFQMKEVGNEKMRAQLASENAALHQGTQNVHESLGSSFDNSVDPQTVTDRGRVIRNAVQGIEKHFDDATDESYKQARAVHGDQPLPQFLTRAQSFLSDESNYMPEGFRRSAQARLQQLKTVGDAGVDGDTPAAPGSVAAAERFREWLNRNRTLDNMHTVKQLVDHTDTDVSEHGGPGMFETARNLRRYSYKLLEEPTGIRKLLTPTDSQGINHAVPTEKVADYVADLPADQHAHVLSVLRAGAHLSPELAESSAAAIREIQAHMVSRIHAAARNADGSWNARKFYNAAAAYAPKLEDTFRERPDVIRNLQTINNAGNTLHMDKHYPGAAAQTERTGAVGHALETGGALLTGLAHDIPLVGRPIGRAIERGVEKATGKAGELSRDREVAKRLVDRNGNQRGSVQVMRGSPAERVKSEFDKAKEDAPLGQLGKRAGNATAELRPDERDPRTVHLEKLAADQPGGGHGTAALRQVTDLADKHGARVSLDAVPQGSAPVPRERLMDYYARHGFRPDGRTAASMTREPKGEVPESQRGSVRLFNDNKLNRQNEERLGTFHGKDISPRNERNERTANQQLGGRRPLTDEQNEVIRRLMGGKQRGSVRVMNGEYEAPDELKNFIRKMAPAHRVDESGPSNWDELKARRNEKVMPINPQGAEGSIYGDVPTNIAFRAWHDKTHLDVNGGFDHDGELKTAIEQLRQAQKAGLSEESQRALWADTWETFKHHEDHGEFPQNPRAFVAQRMQDRTPLGTRIPKQRGSVPLFRESPRDDETYDSPRTEEEGSQINVGLHQGKEGEPGFRKMSKQEAQAAVESVGAKVTKNTVLTPKQHGVYEPTSVMTLDRPLSPYEMQQVLAKTKQSAIPQRTGQGDEEMHVAPGHEQIAKSEGWDTFNPDYFREHDGRTMTEHAKNPSAPNPYPPHPGATVKDPVRSAFPGIYDDPKEIMKRLGPGKPESPHLKEIFDTTRKQLHDDAIARGEVEPKTPIPGITQKGAGSAHAKQVATPENAERIRNIIQAYKEHDPSGYHGMVGWYEMDRMYQSIKKILGGSDAAAGRVYHTLNSLTAYASPMSTVGTEIKRGTAAATMAAEGNFDKFAKYGNLPQAKAPKELNAKNFELGNEGTMAHGSQAPAMGRFLKTGQEANAVKTGTYRRSSDAPSREGSDHQNTVPVGDSHWSRGVGLADVRAAKAFEGSADGPEMKVLGKWFHDDVARHPDIDVPSTSAQAVQWAALSKETGVDTPVGAPKLEIWADMIADAAKRAGVEPKAMWERIIKRLAK